MNDVLARWNSLDPESATREILPCCGSQAWAEALTAKRPYTNEAALLTTSDTIWLSLPEAAWQQAFDSHPRIGQKHAQTHATEASLRWSAQEQRTALSANAAAKLAIEEANRRYEQRFNRIFIVCASGKTTSEILSILEARMNNDPQTELHEAAEQQRQITQLRLRHWLESN
ncbi:MAG TPA: 2-oxo-4-hydroxy-4-carboxy-5-ureidoimidazoline decarboxylase [Edaphobacter sp.]|nr:2-oxo-4-hydroxy-4-carboxy-5-ureidoimidazoline decarboxylase [Edaphobacter sp.]